MRFVNNTVSHFEHFFISRLDHRILDSGGEVDVLCSGVTHVVNFALRLKIRPRVNSIIIQDNPDNLVSRFWSDLLEAKYFLVNLERFWLHFKFKKGLTEW